MTESHFKRWVKGGGTPLGPVQPDDSDNLAEREGNMSVDTLVAGREAPEVLSEPPRKKEVSASTENRGISSVMLDAIHSADSRAQEFSKDILNELREAVNNAVSAVAARHGLCVDKVLVRSEAGEQEADIRVMMSVVDMLGMDRYARMLLSHAEEAGIRPDIYGRLIYYTDPNSQTERRLLVTGLIPVDETSLNPEKTGRWVARVYDVDRKESTMAFARVIGAIASKSR